MYARDVNRQKLTLGVSGMLWNQSLVMYDRETGSNWSHILGKAMDGPLKGTQLEQIPSVMTDWQSWRSQHPNSTVLWISRSSTEYRRKFYRKLDRFVLGVVDNGKAKAWGFERLNSRPVINEMNDGRPVLVTFDRKSVTARLYSRRMEGRTLTFRIARGQLTDLETGSTWEPMTGRALTGPLAGQYLDALPAIVSYKAVWFRFHPRSELGAPR